MPIISDSIGRVLGKRYRLVSALGTGASAHVFLAEDVSLQRYVAVKVLQPTFVADENFLKRFRAESRSVASLNHPHVLRVFDWGEDTDGPYLVLEYLGGGSLRDVLDQDFTLSPAQAAHLGAQVASGLAYAHARGLVHRDIKPANLLFDEEGRVRIADFGVARALAEAAWTEPAGAMVGTARYASPEQAEGRTVDGRADVYSLALVLYEAVTGVVPFVTDTTMGTLMARVGAPLPKHEALGALDDVLVRAAAPDVDARLDARQLGARLESLAGSLPPPEALPLRPPVAGGSIRPVAGFRPPSVGDLTEVVAAAGAAGFGTDGARTVTARSGPGQVFDVEAIEGGPRTKATSPPPVIARRAGRRRRWPWIVAVVALAGAVTAALLVAAHEKLFTPSHAVPTLAGLSVAGARQAVAKDHFGLLVGAPVTSITISPGKVVSQSPRPGTPLKENSSVTVVLSKGLPNEVVPSLSSLDCTGAQRVLAAYHLLGSCPDATQAYSTTVPAGQVINWSYHDMLNPTQAPYGATILMATSKGPPPVMLPSYAGQSYDQASTALAALGLKATQTQQNSSTVPAGQVIGTIPPAGSVVPAASPVTVLVSSGPPMVNVPSVVGEKVAQATTDLQKVGLVVGHVYGPHPKSGTVINTIPQGTQTVVEGSSVDLYVT